MPECQFEAENSVFGQVLASFQDGAQTVNEAHAEKNQIMANDTSLTQEEAMQQVVEHPNATVTMTCG